MIKKILVSIMVLSIMLVMVGTAAANPYNLRIWNAAGTAIADNPLDLKPGDTIVLSLYMEGMVNDSDIYPIDPAIVTAWNGGTSTDVTVTYTTAILTPGGADPYIQVGEVTITLSPTAPIGAGYNIAIGAASANPLDIGLASRNVDSIPEFPLIALPVAGILGLMFIISSRKKKE
ncbi:MAG TPA: PEF-CTERM sorting domain-containing protein [archaeon]|nr:PEF-CTERM sorting domain-containing protein [archaeon]